MIQDILPSLSWSLIGFLVGWLFGREMLFISQIREAVVPEEERAVTDHSKMSGARSKVLGYVVIVLAVFSVLQGSYYAYQTSQTSSCQAQFNADFAVVVAKRAQWANEDKAAETKLWKDFLSAKPGEPREILAAYLQATARTDALRAENPLPKLEDRDC